MKKARGRMIQCPCGNPLCHEKIPRLCGFGQHALRFLIRQVFIKQKIPQLSESPEYFDHWEAENVQLRRRMRASSNPQAYCLWPVWTIEWIRAMQQKKGKKIQVIGRINWGPMKYIFQENLEEWV
jgi:hypothetical protein